MPLPQHKVTVMTRSGNDILLIFDDIMGVLECKRRQSLVVVVHKVKTLHMCYFCKNYDKT
jgi:hypothetical protein